jgi:hypothetical protein
MSEDTRRRNTAYMLGIDHAAAVTAESKSLPAATAAKVEHAMPDATGRFALPAIMRQGPATSRSAYARLSETTNGPSTSDVAKDPAAAMTNETEVGLASSNAASASVVPNTASVAEVSTIVLSPALATPDLAPRRRVPPWLRPATTPEVPAVKAAGCCRRAISARTATKLSMPREIPFASMRLVGPGPTL